MAIKGKYIIVGGLLALSCFGTAFAYWQYTKLRDSPIKFKGIKIKSLAFGKVNFDITIGVTNTSKISLTLLNQKYKLYISDIFISEVNAPSNQEIKAGTQDDLTFNVNLNPQELAKAKITAADLLKGKNIPVRVDMKIGVKVMRIPFNIPYTYATTLGDLVSSDE